MPCNLAHEASLRARGLRFIAGIDEAGRGPLAGPVVAAAVLLPEKFRLRGLNDSKQLTEKQREAFYAKLVAHSEVCWGVAILEAVMEIFLFPRLHVSTRGLRFGAVAADPMAPR